MTDKVNTETVTSTEESSSRFDKKTLIRVGLAVAAIAGVVLAVKSTKDAVAEMDSQSADNPQS